MWKWFMQMVSDYICSGWGGKRVLTTIWKILLYFDSVHSSGSHFQLVKEKKSVRVRVLVQSTLDCTLELDKCRV